MKEIKPPALYKLMGYLEAFGDCIRKSELKWYFEVRLFEFEDIYPSVQVLVKDAYPGSFPETAEIKELSIYELGQALKRELRVESNEPGLLNIVQLVTGFQGEVLDYLNECLNFEGVGARINEYQAAEQLDEFGSGGITADFAAVVVDDKQHRCLFLSGGDSD